MHVIRSFLNVYRCFLWNSLYLFILDKGKTKRNITEEKKTRQHFVYIPNDRPRKLTLIPHTQFFYFVVGFDLVSLFCFFIHWQRHIKPHKFFCMPFFSSCVYFLLVYIFWCLCSVFYAGLQCCCFFFLFIQCNRYLW